MRLAGDLKRLVAGLGFPGAAAARLASDVTPPGGTAPAPSRRAEARAGDLADVRGYDLTAEVVRPGGSVEAAIYWAPRRRVPTGWRLVYRLEGAGWRRELSQVPVSGLMPLGHWRAGQQLRDRVSIPVPPNASPGACALDALLMEGDTVRAQARIAQLTVGR